MKGDLMGVNLQTGELPQGPFDVLCLSMLF